MKIYFHQFLAFCLLKFYPKLFVRYLNEYLQIFNMYLLRKEVNENVQENI
jgi:hypothetical protein